MARPKKTALELQRSGAKPGRIAARLAEEQGTGIAVLEPPAPELVTPVPDIASIARTYAEDVVSGSIVAGQLLRASCQRFLTDLNRPDIFFDAASAQHIGDYAAALHLELLPWECFILANIFGFKKLDGARRYSLAYVAVARKNGKSTLCALIVLYMADPEGDGEPNADVFIAATSRYQSRDIVFRSALKFRSDSPELSDRTQAFRTSIIFKDSGRIEPLAANPERLAGLNIHCGILDELGDHPTGDLYNVFRSSTTGRRQPLTLSITTAGAVRDGNIAWAQHQHALQVLDGTTPDDGFFPFIAMPDKDDDWQAEDTWRKANPSYGSLVNPEQMKQLAREAKNIRSAKLSFFRYNLNIWPSTTLSSWLDANDLSKKGCAYLDDAEKKLSIPERLKRAEARLKDRYAYLGLDLALVDDLSVLGILFPPPPGSEIFEALFKIWVPEENIERRSKEHRVPYREWQDEGFLIATPGDCVDFSFIERDIIALRSQFTIREMGFDVALARDLVSRIQNSGMKVTQVRQGFALHPAIQRIEKLVKEGKLCIHGHPVANWCFSNVVLNHGVRDSRFDKAKSREKIDCAVAVANCFDVFMAEPQSVYSYRGIFTI